MMDSQLWMDEWVDEVRKAGIPASKAVASYDEQYGGGDTHKDTDKEPRECARRWLLSNGYIPPNGQAHLPGRSAATERSSAAQC